MGRCCQVAVFRAYAKVVEPTDPSVRLYEAGVWTGCGGRPPGLVLAEVLQRTGGVYETTVWLTPELRADIREAGELTADAELLAIAELPEVPVSLEHLRDLDPQTRILVRAELRYEGGEGLRAGRSRERRPGLATILADGTVVSGDVRPERASPDGADSGDEAARG
jgi:hypothetical protein